MDLSAEGWHEIFVAKPDETGAITDETGTPLIQFTNDTGGQTGNMNPNELKPNDPIIEQLNRIMSTDKFINELSTTRDRSSKARSFNPSDTTPPDFETIKEYNMSVYNPAKKQVYEGNWNDRHPWIASSNGIKEDNPYISGVVIKLQGTYARIFQISLENNCTISYQDIKALQELGFKVMNVNNNWIIADNGQLIEVSSPLSFTH